MQNEGDLLTMIMTDMSVGFPFCVSNYVEYFGDHLCPCHHLEGKHPTT